MGVVDGSIHWNGQNNFFDFIQFHAERLGMTREEYISHFGTANHGINERNKKPGPDPYHRGLDDEEVEDKEAQIKKQAKMDDDDPDAYKEMPGDKEAREKGEVKTSKATKAYNKLYGEDLDEGVMSNIHLMIDASKDFEDFKKMFKKDYKKIFQNTPAFMDWLYGMYKDAAPEKVEESEVNERAAMGYDGHTGLFYFEGVPFTQERLDEVIAWLKDTVIKAAKDLPKQFTYRPAIQIEDEVGGEQVTFDTNKIKYLEYIRKQFKGKLAHDEDFNESNQIGEANEPLDKMAFSQLERIIDYATMLRDRMAAGKSLDAWMYGKIVKAEDYLNTLYDVVDGDDGVVETQKMTNKDWKKIKKFNKHVTDSGEKFVMSYDDRIGTFLEPVEIVDEGVLSNVRKAVEKTKKTLKKKWNAKGGYENFGQDEIRDLEDKYDYNSMLYGTPEERNAAKLIDGLNQWAMNYVGESTVEEAASNFKTLLKTAKQERPGRKIRLGDRKDPDHETWEKISRYYWKNLKTGEELDFNEWAKHADEFQMAGHDLQFEAVETPEHPVNEEDDKDKKSTDRGPLDDDKIETALKKKAEDTGVPIGIIRAVMRRGLAAWKSGHRPGANQQQWGYARVNAFLTKGEGTWGGADSDLAKEVRDGGHDKKLKKA